MKARNNISDIPIPSNVFKVGEGHFGVSFNSRNLPKTQNSDHRNENNSMKHPKRIKSSREAR